MGRVLNERFFNPVTGTNGESVASFTITNGGSYTAIPGVTVSNPELPGGVVATAGAVHMGAISATVGTIGTGDSSADYAPGDVLSVAGGTGTAPEFDVVSVKIRTAGVVGDGGGFVDGNTVTFSTGWATPAVLTLTVDGGGAITAISITNAGVRTSALPTDPVQPDSTNGPGTLAGTTFNLGFGINAIALSSAGDLTALAANPAATTTDSANGTGATLNVAYEVIAVDVANPGSGYVAPTATFDAGAATADVVLTATGSNVILAHAYVAGGTTDLDSDIVKQTGTSSYLMKNTEGQSICKLVANSVLTEGQAYIMATDSLGSTYYVTKLTAHKAVLHQWTDGGSGFLYNNFYSAPWSFAAAADIVVQIETV